MFNINSNLPNFDARIRIVQAAPSLQSLDIYCDGNVIATNITFGSITNYLPVKPGEHLIELFRASTYENPIFKDRLELMPNASKTLSVVFSNKTLSLAHFDDTFYRSHSEDTSYLRFVNLSPNSPLLTLKLNNNKPLFSNVEFLENTSFYELPSGVYNLKLSSPDLTSLYNKISNVSLPKKSCSTIYIIGILNGEPQLGYLLAKDN